MGGGPGITGWRGREAGPDGQSWWYGPEVEDEICRRVAEGETLYAVCASPGMPSHQTARRWVRRRPGFSEKLDAARREAGKPSRAADSRYCVATFDAIFDRLCLGEGLVAICSDPAMPAPSTVYRWQKARPEVREALDLARQIHGDRVGELSFEEAMKATPETARAAEVRLRHLRWWAAKLSPLSYGSHRAQTPAAAAEAAEGTDFLARSFWLEVRPADGWRRVRGHYPDPDTGRPVDEPPGEWTPPPVGWTR